MSNVKGGLNKKSSSP